MNNPSLVLIFYCLFFYIGVFAHGDLDERILAITEEIKITPDDASLYFQRGKLFYQHEEYEKSLDDLKKAKNLNFDSEEQNLCFARNYFRLENYNKVIEYADIILNNDDQHVLAIRIKARTYLKLNRFYDAAILFEKVIQSTRQSFPENYIETSLAWESLNSEEGNVRAIAIIKSGLKELGEITSLYDRLIQITLNQKKYELAIATQKKVIELSNRKENAYYKLSELYELNDDLDLAIKSLSLAKSHFNELPLRIQNTSFMKQLLVNINKKEILYQPNN